ncbi:hypothetical protein M0804_004016 [Polistes exclamans]|nr:hypothetical protein M0804_004016 [Polistes exclamans]
MRKPWVEIILFCGGGGGGGSDSSEVTILMVMVMGGGGGRVNGWTLQQPPRALHGDGPGGRPLTPPYLSPLLVA